MSFEITPTFDELGYPDDRTLEDICRFSVIDEAGFFKLAEKCFNKHYGYWKIIENYQNPEINDNKPLNILKICTGGWSGNEMLINSMAANVLWHGHLLARFRGGTYILEIRQSS